MLFPYFGRIPAIASGPDQLGKWCRRLRGGVGIEGAHVTGPQSLCAGPPC